MNVPAEILADGPVIPVVVAEHVSDAVAIARALVAGGVRVIELTLRTERALDAIRAITEQVEDVTVGAGTITRPAEVELCMRAGAKFGVSPGLTPALADAATFNGLPLLPGVMTPSEVMLARDAGYQRLKFFPAHLAGGPSMLTALSGPFPDMTFCPTGGVTISNAGEYLALANVACVGGSWLVPREAIANRDWPQITRLASESRALARKWQAAGPSP